MLSRVAIINVLKQDSALTVLMNVLKMYGFVLNTITYYTVLSSVTLINVLKKDSALTVLMNALKMYGVVLTIYITYVLC